MEIDIIIPMLEFWNDIAEMYAGILFSVGESFWGVYMDRAPWFYYQVVTIFKLPVTSQILSVIGIIYALMLYGRSCRWQVVFSFAFIVVIYAFVMVKFCKYCFTNKVN